MVLDWDTNVGEYAAMAKLPLYIHNISLQILYRAKQT